MTQTHLQRSDFEPWCSKSEKMKIFIDTRGLTTIRHTLLICKMSLTPQLTNTRSSTTLERTFLERDPGLRPYQVAALTKISEHPRCLVKMFCGTGKSRVVQNLIRAVEIDLMGPASSTVTTTTTTTTPTTSTLSVIVFPSLALVRQFSADYLISWTHHRCLNVSSEILDDVDSTTDKDQICDFLFEQSTPRIVLVTYQSLVVLAACLDDTGCRPNMVCFDEAHHVTGAETSKTVFKEGGLGEKEYFFTATPRNSNGIMMVDEDNDDEEEDVGGEEEDIEGDDEEDGEAEEEAEEEYDEEAASCNSSVSPSTQSIVSLKTRTPRCGPIAVNYTYLDGLNDGILNGFDVCVDMYSENTNEQLYDAIARAVLSRGTTRVLTFHGGVNGIKNTHVRNFVKVTKFREAMAKVWAAEFPEKPGFRACDITMVGMDGTTPAELRQKHLAALDRTPASKVFILCSCETIGEGVDTKRANMCVFADPKTSSIKIIQNIGRVLRPDPDTPISTVLIPCWVNKEHYAEATTDEEKDAIIREQMRATNGDYAAVLNVLGALKQEDPELYDMCLRYPNRKHKMKSLKEQGYCIAGLKDEFTGGEKEEKEKVEELKEDTCIQNEEVDVAAAAAPMAAPLLNGNAVEDVRIYSMEEVLHMKKQRIPLEIHTDDGDNEYINADLNADVEWTRLYYDVDAGNFRAVVPIKHTTVTDNSLSSSSASSSSEACTPDLRKRLAPMQRRVVRMSVHQDTEIQMLWRAREVDMSKKFGTTVIECSVSGSVERWWKRHEELVVFLNAHGRAPNQRANTPEEKTLGNWVCNQKQNYAPRKHIMTTPAIYDAWAALIQDPKYAELLDLDPENAWWKRREELVAFINAHGRTPSSTSKTPEEKTLGSWVSNQKHKYASRKQIMTTPTIYNAWTALIQDPKYAELLDLDPEKAWWKRCDELVTFMNAHGRTPINNSNTPDEKTLASWASKQRQSYASRKHIMATPIVYNAWTALLQDPGYAALLENSEKSWYRRREELITFMNAHERAPNKQAKTPEEKALGTWVGTQKHNYASRKQIMATPAIYNAWTVLLQDPRYAELLDLDPEKVWYRRCDDLITFMNAHERAPSSTAKTPEEKTLGLWVGKQKQNYASRKRTMSTPAIYNAWTALLQDPKYAELLESAEKTWYRRREELITFMNAHERSPSTRAKPPEEKTLGNWVSAQKNTYASRKYIMSTPAIYDAWTALVQDPRYADLLDLDPEKAWWKRHGELTIFMNTHERAPSQTSKTPEEKTLGKWVCKQKQNYASRKRTMSTPAIYNAWTALLQDPRYAELLDLDPEKAWWKRHGELITFMNAHELAPSSTAKTPEEKTLGSWLSAQKQNYASRKNSMVAYAIYNAWTTLLQDPKYAELLIIDLKKTWWKRHEELVVFMNAHERAPSSTAKTPEEKTLGSWLSTQKKKHASQKEIMATPAIYNAWTALIETPAYTLYLKYTPLLKKRK